MKQTLKNTYWTLATCVKKVTCDSLTKAPGYHRLLSRRSSKAGKDTEARKHEVCNANQIFLKPRETENVVGTSWWRQCADVSKLSCGNEECGLVPDRLVVESITYAKNIAVVGEDDSDSHFGTLNLSQNESSLRVIYECLRYNTEEVEKTLVEETNLSLVRLDTWIVAVVQCFVEQDI